MNAPTPTACATAGTAAVPFTKSAGEIRALVRRVKELWRLGGGIILAPSHETLPDTPVENLLAIYEETMEPWQLAARSG
jgi:uroporphyrinogen-III decarboxylase